MRLAPAEDEDLATLSIVHRLILPQVKESSEVTSRLGSAKKMEPGSCLDSTVAHLRWTVMRQDTVLPEKRPSHLV